MAFHRNELIGSMHIVHQFEYADAAARTGATGLLPADIGKVARQLDNDSFYVLMSDSPVSWMLINGTALINNAEAQTIHAAGSAIPGAIYLETTSDTFYFGKSDGRLIDWDGLSPPAEQAAPWVDFRFVDMATLTNEITTGVTITQDTSRGLYCATPGVSWNRGVKFMDGQWARADSKKLTFVLMPICTATMMFGLIDATQDINTLSSVYEGEVSCYISNCTSSRCYGQTVLGGSSYKSFSPTAQLTPNQHLRFEMPIGPGAGMGGNLKIDEVSAEDWDVSTASIVDYALGDIGGLAAQLVPFWTTYQTACNMIYIAGYKVT